MTYLRDKTMKATQMLHDLGHSLWLNNGTLRRLADGGDCEAVLVSSPGLALTSLPWPPSSRKKVPHRSSNPGMNSWR
jgi:hypothetical protein